jgi:hypothetical protein
MPFWLNSLIKGGELSRNGSALSVLQMYSQNLIKAITQLSISLSYIELVQAFLL